MTNTIEISDHLAESLLRTLSPSVPGTRQLDPNTPVSTRVTLMNRGLAQHDANASREAGYGIYTLTDLGVAMRQWLLSYPKRRSFDREILTDQAQAILPKMIAEEAATETVVEYSVKIWYRSGAYEGVAHSPEELAYQIFADAVKSAGVEFAELHGPSGILVQFKPRHEEQHVSTEPDPKTYPDENGFLSSLPQVDESLVAPTQETPDEPEPSA